jgi:hypothetical protein
LFSHWYFGPSRPLPPFEEGLDQSFEVHLGGVGWFGLHLEVLLGRCWSNT